MSTPVQTLPTVTVTGSYTPGAASDTKPEPAPTGVPPEVWEVQQMAIIADKVSKQLYPNATEINNSIIDGYPDKVMNTFLTSLSGQSIDNTKDIFSNINKLNDSFINLKNSNGFAQVHTDTPYENYVNFEHNRSNSIYFGNLFANSLPSLGTGESLSSNTHDFYGTMFIPLQGLYYWIFGNGEDRHININALNLSNSISFFEPAQKIINSNPKPGTYTFDNANIELNTHGGSAQDQPAAFLIGRVSGQMDGTLVVNSDQTYVFSATYTLNNDTYNADLGTGRSRLTEDATKVLSTIGEIFGHSDYKIYFDGKRTVRIEGKTK